MLKWVVTKDKTVVTDHTFEENLTGRYADDVEIFEFDDADTPLFSFAAPVNPSGFLTANGSTAPTKTPLSDPRLRVSLDECKAITIGLIKRWCSDYILSVYPTYKQLNIMMRMGYTDKDFTAMTKFITAVRDTSNTIENLITSENKDNSSSKEAILDIDYKAEIRAASTK